MSKRKSTPEDDYYKTGFATFKAILAAMREDGKRTFSADDPKIHDAIAGFQKDARYAKYWGQFQFEDRGRFYYSRELNTAIWALQMAGLLSCMGPDLDRYLILKKLTAYWEEDMREHYSEENVEAIREMAKEFAKAVEAKEEE